MNRRKFSDWIDSEIEGCISREETTRLVLLHELKMKIDAGDFNREIPPPKREKVIECPQPTRSQITDLQE